MFDYIISLWNEQYSAIVSYCIGYAFVLYKNQAYIVKCISSLEIWMLLFSQVKVCRGHFIVVTIIPSTIQDVFVLKDGKLEIEVWSLASPVTVSYCIVAFVL